VKRVDQMEFSLIAKSSGRPINVVGQIIERDL
jgi:hypothetical protein